MSSGSLSDQHRTHFHPVVQIWSLLVPKNKMATCHDAKLDQPAGDFTMELHFVSVVDVLNQIKQTCSSHTEMVLDAQV